MTLDTYGRFAPIKRFLAIFFIIWAVVLVVLGINGSGTSRAIMLIAAVACLIAGGYCARSFSFLQRKEF